MRNIFILIFWLMSFFVTSGVHADEPQIAWTTVKDRQSLGEVIQSAASQTKMSVLYFYVDWSIDANRIDKNLWIPKKGHEHLNFIKVDLSAWGDEAKQLATQYNLSQKAYTPVLVLLDSKGQPVKHKKIVDSNSLTKETFALWLRETNLNQASSSSTRGKVALLSIDSTGLPKIDEVDSVFTYHVSHKKDTIIAVFKIAPNYYLYREKFKAAINGHPVPGAKLRIVGAPARYTDTAWGEQEIYVDNVQIELNLDYNRFVACGQDATNQLELYYQGSSKAGMFYPPQKRTVPFQAGC